jgi:hypothetical protein
MDVDGWWENTSSGKIGKFTLVINSFSKNIKERIRKKKKKISSKELAKKKVEILILE